MRVLHVTRDYLSNGGIGRYVQGLSAALSDVGHDVAVICGEGAPDGRADIHLVPGCDEFEHRNARANRLSVLELASAFRPDVVLLHAMDDYRLELALRRRHRVARFVHNHVYCPSGLDHDATSLRPCERRQGRACIAGYLTRRCWSVRRPSIALAFQNRAAASIANLRTAPLVFSASEYVRGRLARHGVDARRIVVAPYFADVPGIEPLGAPAPSAGDTLLYVGRIVPEKGVGYVLQAMRRMRFRARLVVNGDGPARPETEALASRLGLADRVAFAGWTCRASLHASYAGADVVVVPSVWPEPFGLVGIEAMAYGKPVAAFRTGAIPEWLDDGETGFAVAPGDVAALARRLDELFADHALRFRMGRAARARVARDFSPDRHLATMCDGIAAARWP